MRYLEMRLTNWQEVNLILISTEMRLHLLRIFKTSWHQGRYSLNTMNCNSQLKAVN